MFSKGKVTSTPKLREVLYPSGNYINDSSRDDEVTFKTNRPQPAATSQAASNDTLEMPEPIRRPPISSPDRRMVGKVMFHQPFPKDLLFTGDSDDCPHIFLERVRAHMELAGETPDRMRLLFGSLLRGGAFDWYRSLPEVQKKDLDTISDALIKQYTDPGAEWLGKLHLMRISQNVGESVADYTTRFLKLSNRLGTPSQQCLNIFVNGLKPDFRLEVIRCKPKSFNDAMRQAKFAESILVMAKPELPLPKIKVAQSVQSDGADKFIKSLDVLSSQLSSQFASFEERMNSRYDVLQNELESKYDVLQNGLESKYDGLKTEIEKFRETRPNQPSDRFNNYDNNFGNNYNRNRFNSGYRRGGYVPRNIVCYNCGANDHYRSQCTKPPYVPGPEQDVRRKNPRGN